MCDETQVTAGYLFVIYGGFVLCGDNFTVHFKKTRQNVIHFNKYR